MLDYYMNYDKDHPYVVYDVLAYFSTMNHGKKKTKDKSIVDFCQNPDGSFKYQPQIISRICKRLVDVGVLECIVSRGGLGLYDNYLFLSGDDAFFEEGKDIISQDYNCTVYGFRYIYDLYKDIVVPLVWEKTNGDYSAGTGFKFLNGIVTAKHCITDPKNLSIKGYSADELRGMPIYVSDNEDIDLAFITTNTEQSTMVLFEEGKIMQEVLVMGYPKIPAFTPFLTAEKATISSKASARITPTKGAIAGFGYEYLSKMDALLITARIRGGNSGGPVINERGRVVGIACHFLDNNPENGDYDDMGYGVAIPVSYLLDIINRTPCHISVGDDFFRDYVD